MHNDNDGLQRTVSMLRSLIGNDPHKARGILTLFVVKQMNESISLWRCAAEVLKEFDMTAGLQLELAARKVKHQMGVDLFKLTVPLTGSAEADAEMVACLGRQAEAQKQIDALEQQLAACNI